MKKATIVVVKDYLNNRLFDLSDSRLNRDNCLRPFALLKEMFLERGYDLSTQDINPSDSSEIVLYNEMPKKLESIEREISYLMIFESELIRPDNWDVEKHDLFNKVFTWNDDLVDDVKYIKMNFPNNFIKPTTGVDKREKLAALISGNKTSNHKKELYSKRLETINWFEKKHVSDFDYYGIGWDKYNFGSQFIGKILAKTKLEKLLPKRQTPCYKGLVDNKVETLQNYKFNICYENAKDITGYITEKIFDSFFAGCIPVYWGPQNIEKHIPSNCFVDRRKFESHEDLYLYLTAMSKEEIETYQSNISKFLESNASSLFRAEEFAKNIVENVFNE